MVIGPRIRLVCSDIDQGVCDHIEAVRMAMERLTERYDPAELNRIGFSLYEKFRPDVPPGAEGLAKKAVLDIGKILSAA